MKPFKYAYLEALRDADLTHTEYRVLVNLLTYADADGTNAYPSIAMLVDDCLLSERQVQRCLRRLCESGWIRVASPGGRIRGGRGKATEYVLTTPKKGVNGVTLSNTNRVTNPNKSPEEKGATGDAPPMQLPHTGAKTPVDEGYKEDPWGRVG
ncbi:helix-turn-helix domain-containing protein [Mycobacterium sp. IS-1556]|uniref:helix-turn-helix domain-containing protein n=1 Tax=Mycobacterium sp. IS-1556 TaxID=1772276 RepID=UPI000B2DFC3D|nr:helix-turn-helix domain-containing protein [Mycobacterium sp. IS-1556]